MTPRMVIRRAAADDLDLAAAYLACGHQVLESILRVSRGCTELERTDRRIGAPSPSLATAEIVRLPAGFNSLEPQEAGFDSLS